MSASLRENLSIHFGIVSVTTTSPHITQTGLAGQLLLASLMGKPRTRLEIWLRKPMIPMHIIRRVDSE
jgi:hypothetical protein